MNSNIQTTISKANLESCLSDSWLMGIMKFSSEMDIGEILLDVPELINVTIKPREATQ